MSAQADNALTALERARQAQERFERRIDVQLRIPVVADERVPPGTLALTDGQRIIGVIRECK